MRRDSIYHLLHARCTAPYFGDQVTLFHRGTCKCTLLEHKRCWCRVKERSVERSVAFHLNNAITRGRINNLKLGPRRVKHCSVQHDSASTWPARNRYFTRNNDLRFLVFHLTPRGLQSRRIRASRRSKVNRARRLN